jgi:hypothetical protein
MDKFEVSKCFLPKDTFDDFVEMSKEQKWGRKPKPITKLVWPIDNLKGAGPNGQ